MSLTWRLPSETYLDEVERDRVAEALRILDLSTGTAIDSYEMSADGPRLSSIFVLNADYIVEIRVATKQLNFDISSAQKVMNIRVAFGMFSIPDATAAAEVTETLVTEGNESAVLDQLALTPTSESRLVTITILHNPESRSVLSYFKQDINEWLRYALAACPKERLSS